MDERGRLVAKLRQLGVLRSEEVEVALAGLPDAAFVRAELRSFAHLDIPWPEADGFTVSPRLTVLLAELLEPVRGRRVLALPKAPRLLRAVLEAIGVNVVERAEPGVDCALLFDADWVSEDAARDVIVEGGFLLRVRIDAFGEDLVKYVKTGGEWIRMRLTQLRLEPKRSLRPGHDAAGEPLGNLLVVEGIERRVWDDAAERSEDIVFQEAVRRTWNPPADDGMPEPEERHLLARKLFHLAYVNQAVGDLANAIDLYTASLDTYATAEAFTFRSWTLSLLGDFDRAIDGCKRAIEVDPEFGNPYNDIGAYLLEQGRAGEALQWLERAKHAPRYEAPHFAHTNAGRAHLLLGHTRKARAEFEKALRMAPDYAPARRLLALMDERDLDEP